MKNPHLTCCRNDAPIAFAAPRSWLAQQRVAFPALLAGLTALATIAMAREPLRVAVVNRTATNWALYAGLSQGFFAAEDLDLQLQYSGSSEKLTAELLAGRSDVGHMAAGNVVEAARRGEDLVIVMGVNRPVFSLVVRRGVDTPQKLKSARIGVDNLSTGYVHLVRRYLSANGVADSDVTLRDVGGVDARYKALLAGDIEAALLSSPRDLEAIDRGFSTLTELDEPPDRYTGSVAVVSRAWAIAHRAPLVRYLRAYVRSLAWLYDPQNADRAARLVAAELELDPSRARQIYDDVIGRRAWLVRDGGVHPDGMREVVRLMDSDSSSAPRPFRFEDYVELSWLNEAKGSTR